MPTLHTIKIINGKFLTPEPSPLCVGDSVKWKNLDPDNAHSAVSEKQEGPFHFKTKDLYEEDESDPVDLTYEGEYAYFCGKHPHMKSSLSVKPQATRAMKASLSELSISPKATENLRKGTVNLFGGLPQAIDRDSMEEWNPIVWHKIRQIVAAGGCYDVIQDFQHALAALPTNGRTLVENEWNRIIKWWQSTLGWAAPLDAPDALQEQRWHILEGLYRRLRASWYVLSAQKLIRKYPNSFIQSPARSESHDEFLEAITVIPGKVPHYIGGSWGLTADYAYVATMIQVAFDKGTSPEAEYPNDTFRQDYWTARARLHSTNYLVLALRQVRGLTNLRGSDEFDRAWFSERYWRATVWGEWNQPVLSAWNWVHFLNGYLDSMTYGATPHLVGPQGKWTTPNNGANPFTLFIELAEYGYKLRSEVPNSHIVKVGLGLLVEDKLFCAMVERRLGYVSGVMLLARHVDGVSSGTNTLKGRWIHSPYPGLGAFAASPVGGHGALEGEFDGSFESEGGVSLDSGILSLKKDGERYLVEWSGKALLHGVGLDVSSFLPLAPGLSNHDWIVVAFTDAHSASARVPIELSVLNYNLDKLIGRAVASDSATEVSIDLGRHLAPLDY